MRTFKAPTSLPTDPTQLAGAMTDAMRSMEQAAQRAHDYMELQTLHAAPAKLRVGMSALADGTDWDPGEGAGYYFYVGGGVWEKLLRASDVTSYTGVGTHVVELSTGNGYGSTNTKIRRFSTVVTNTGSAFTLAQSSTNGDSVTVNEPGLYSILYAELPSTAGIHGISLNSSQLTTAVQTITYANRVAMTYGGTTGVPFNLSVTMQLVATDVIRAHAGTSTSTDTTNNVRFVIRKIGI